jgi:hypothetical protein
VKVRSCAQHLTCIPFPRAPLTHTIPLTAPEVALRTLTAGPVPALNGGPSPTQRRQDHKGRPCVRPERCNQTQPLCRRKRITDQAPCSHTEDDAGAQKMPGASTHQAPSGRGSLKEEGGRESSLPPGNPVLDVKPRGREMPLEARAVRQPCAILLLLCGCVQSFPPHFGNPKASATSLPLTLMTP